MAKLDKRLMKIVNKMAEDSFSAEGALEEKKTSNYFQSLRSLSHSQSIVALSQYLKMIKMGLSKTTLDIESVISLTDVQVKEVVASIKAKQPVIAVNTKTNDSLLGGLRVKIGDIVYDDSISQRIAQLKGAING